MNNKISWLSASKVRIHGMVSSRWTTKDKITQYKGLIKLYTRDKKITDMDAEVMQRKQGKELKKVQEDIENNRAELNNAISGDKQKLRNTLNEHKELQLAYQDSHPNKVIDRINQINFTKRKELDRIRYKTKLKAEELVDLKLRYAELEDRVKLRSMGVGFSPEEKQMLIVTGKVQDAILKKEAALSIRHTYNQMISIMKKDALYFDAVLITIRADGSNQSKCMINATKLGQLATEYLDDRKKEFSILEKAVRKAMNERKDDLLKANHRIECFNYNTKNLLRRDSDINLGKIDMPPTISLLSLQNDIQVIFDTLQDLKYSISVPTFDDIYPCFQKQLEHKEKLEEFVKTCQEQRNILLKKKNHADIIKSIMVTTMTSTTLEYRNEKLGLLEIQKEHVERKKAATVLIETRLELLAKIRICLKHLQMLSGFLSSSTPIRLNKVAVMSRLIKIHQGDVIPDLPDEEENDGTKIVTELFQRFQKLFNAAKSLDSETKVHAFKCYEEMMHNRTKSIPTEKPPVEESLIESIFFDAHVFTRDDIKKQSAKIVAQNQKSDEFEEVDKKRLRY